MRILIVDDSKYMRFLIRSIVEEAGHEVVGEASNGEMAVEYYDTLMPDIVFMDITMPIMSGFEALKEIRSKHPKAVVVMCSAMGQQWLVMDSILAGAKDFITKPFKPENLLYIIDKMSPERRRF